MQKRLLLDAIQPSTGMGGTKKDACNDWKNFCFRQLCVDSDRLCTDSYNIKCMFLGISRLICIALCCLLNLTVGWLSRF
jgi:hypothetical protein